MTDSNQTINLSDSLETAIDFETYGLFMIPVTKYSATALVDDVLKWARNQDFVKHDRQAISHNIQQIGETNQILTDLPELKALLLEVARKHNQSGLNYASNFEISDCYLEVAHSYLKFKRNTISNTYPIMMLPYESMTAFNLQEATIPYAAGDIVIYPSNLTHGFDSNPTDNRITLTFNVIPI